MPKQAVSYIGNTEFSLLLKEIVIIMLREVIPQ